MAFPFELNKQGKKRYFHDIRKDLPKFESIKNPLRSMSGGDFYIMKNIIC